ncbi:FMRFamide receptor-like [Ruditapes philippinarum]|jgi:somatostatin receptor 2|uniref:FMRFamide receptor-like n=1 Tax=Ruditapes philippinarum TaxID=129788 RepID=UPI00295A814C|nr:FMRFamide receptor-like [Ruditapes philippinarum]
MSSGGLSSGNWTANKHIFKNDDILYENITKPLLALPFHPITSFLERYTIPVICVFGLITNTLSSVVFLQKPLKNNSCSIYLAARGIADNGFLLTLLIIWISQVFHLRLGTISGSCSIIIFLSYVCGFISVWLVVFVTFENYIRICKPFVVKQVCTKTIAEIVLLILGILSVCLYNFPFWAISADDCVPFPQHSKTVQAFVYADTVITLALPLCGIIHLMGAIVCSLIKSSNIRKKRTKSGVTQSGNTLAKVTKMLFAVTATFFCLNVPSHIYRYVIMINGFVFGKNDNARHSIQEEAVHHTTLLLSYLSLSTNIIVYLVFGSKFRQVLVKMCFTCFSSTKRENRQSRFDWNRPCRNPELNKLQNPVTRSLTVLVTDKEWTSKLVPLERAYTN